jgi:ATP/ADP translocase
LAKFEKKIVNLYKQEKLKNEKKQSRKRKREDSLEESTETTEETSKSATNNFTSVLPSSYVVTDQCLHSSIGKENVRDEFFEQTETEMKRQKRLKYKMVENNQTIINSLYVVC